MGLSLNIAASPESPISLPKRRPLAMQKAVIQLLLVQYHTDNVKQKVSVSQKKRKKATMKHKKCMVREL